jgi:hypothetical protein
MAPRGLLLARKVLYYYIQIKNGSLCLCFYWIISSHQLPFLALRVQVVAPSLVLPPPTVLDVLFLPHVVLAAPMLLWMAESSFLLIFLDKS